MAQTYVVPTVTDAVATSLATNAANDLEALRSMFSGTTAPTSPTPVAGQCFYNTSTNAIQVYDGTTWRTLFTNVQSTAIGRVPHEVQITEVGLPAAGTTNFNVFTAEQACTFIQGSIVSSAACATHASNYYTFKLLRAGSTDINATATTNSSGGVAITADTRYALGAVSSAAITANTVVQFQSVVTGIPTALSACRFLVAILVSYP